MIRPNAAFFCLLLTAACIGPASAARFQFEPHGGSGEIQNVAICPSGEFVVGFEGRVGAWIDRIAPVCAPLLPSGALGKRHAITAFGGSGGGPASAYCETGAIDQITYSLTEDNRMVLWITFLCHDPVTGEGGKRYFVFGNTGAVWGNRFQNPCPRRYPAATGLAAHWGQHVNAIGLICDKVPGN